MRVVTNKNLKFRDISVSSVATSSPSLPHKNPGSARAVGASQMEITSDITPNMSPSIDPFQDSPWPKNVWATSASCSTMPMILQATPASCPTAACGDSGAFSLTTTTSTKKSGAYLAPITTTTTTTTTSGAVDLITPTGVDNDTSVTESSSIMTSQPNAIGSISTTPYGASVSSSPICAVTTSRTKPVPSTIGSMVPTGHPRRTRAKTSYKSVPPSTFDAMFRPDDYTKFFDTPIGTSDDADLFMELIPDIGDVAVHSKGQDDRIIEASTAAQSEVLQSWATRENTAFSIVTDPVLNTCVGTVVLPDEIKLNGDYLETASKLKHALSWNEPPPIRVETYFAANRRHPSTPLRIAKLTFDGRVVPPHYNFLGRRLQVRPYTRRPRQCRKCWRYGHPDARCYSEYYICPKCGAPSHGNLPCELPVQCILCHEPHPAYAKRCSHYQFQEAALAYTLKHGVSFKLALLYLRSEDVFPPRSFARAVIGRARPPAAEKPDLPPSSDTVPPASTLALPGVGGASVMNDVVASPSSPHHDPSTSQVPIPCSESLPAVDNIPPTTGVTVPVSNSFASLTDLHQLGDVTSAPAEVSMSPPPIHTRTHKRASISPKASQRSAKRTLPTSPKQRKRTSFGHPRLRTSVRATVRSTASHVPADSVVRRKGEPGVCTPSTARPRSPDLHDDSCGCSDCMVRGISAFVDQTPTDLATNIDKLLSGKRCPSGHPGTHPLGCLCASHVRMTRTRSLSPAITTRFAEIRKDLDVQVLRPSQFDFHHAHSSSPPLPDPELPSSWSSPSPIPRKLSMPDIRWIQQAQNQSNLVTLTPLNAS